MNSLPKRHCLSAVKIRSSNHSLNEKRAIKSIRRCAASSAFANRWCRYEARAQITRRHGIKCTSLYILYLRVCRANTLLRETTTIHGCSASPALLKIGDADARSVQKTPAGVLVVRRGLFFVKRQRRCAAYFQKHPCKFVEMLVQ